MPDRTRPVPPMPPGIPERRPHDHKRNRTASPFAAPDIAAGFVVGKCRRHHRAGEFPGFLKEADPRIPEGSDVHVVTDNHAPKTTSPGHGRRAGRHRHVRFTLSPASPDRSGRAPVRRGVRTTATEGPCFRKAARSGYRHLHRKSQPKPATLQVDEIRRRHSQCRRMLPSPSRPLPLGRPWTAPGGSEGSRRGEIVPVRLTFAAGPDGGRRCVARKRPAVPSCPIPGTRVSVRQREAPFRNSSRARPPRIPNAAPDPRGLRHLRTCAPRARIAPAAIPRRRNREPRSDGSTP